MTDRTFISKFDGPFTAEQFNSLSLPLCFSPSVSPLFDSPLSVSSPQSLFLFFPLFPSLSLFRTLISIAPYPLSLSFYQTFVSPLLSISLSLSLMPLCFLSLPSDFSTVHLSLSPPQSFPLFIYPETKIAVQPGRDSWERTAGTGQPGQDSRDRTAGTGKPGQESRDEKAGTGQPGRDSPDGTARTGQPGQTGQDSRNKTAGMGEPGQNRRDRKTKTVRPGKDK